MPEASYFPAYGLVLGAVLGILQLQLFFLANFSAYGLVLGAVLGISAVTATFSRNFSSFWAGFWKLFWEFFVVTATFLAIFPAFGLNLGSCFKRFSDYSSPRSAYYAINPPL